MKTVAVIPARIGSRRIPKKNIKLFLGKTLISYSIQAAKESGVFDRIVVSTDSLEIADIAKQCGAEIPFIRPPELSGDHTTTDDVLLHSLNWFNTNWGQTDYVCLLYSTPFARPEYIKKGLELIIQEKATTAFTVTTFPYPIFRAMKVDGRGRMEMFWPENRHARSQDFPEAIHDAAQFYWIDSRKYAVDKHLFSSDSVPIMLPRKYAQDIDTQEDWERAEIMYTALKSESK